MGKKRKQDPGREDSSSSGAKWCRSCHCQNGDASRPNEGFSDTFLDAAKELKDVIQVKLSTEEKFKRKIQKLKERRKKDKNKNEEDLRVLKEDLRKLKENLEELKLQIQEMRKEECAEVNHYKASLSQRSQLSQSTRYRLVIQNSVKSTIYKNRTVQNEDGGGHIKVVMYDGNDPIVSEHVLASIKVELVLIEGVFDEKRDSWSKEEFKESIIQPQKTTGLTSLVKNATFYLSDGRCDYEGAIIMDNSKRKEVKLGVRIAGHTKIRVLEGVSNPFKVQEGKTEKSVPNKKGNKPSPPVRMRNLVQPTNTQATHHGQGPVSTDFLFSKRVSPDEQHSLPPPVNQGVSQNAVVLPRNFPDHGKHSEFPTDDTAEDNQPSYTPATVSMMVEGNGQALNGNGQQSCQQIPTQIPISPHSMQHGQYCSLTPTSIQNLLQAPGNCPVNHHLLASGQDQDNNFPNASSELAFVNNHSLDNILQVNTRCTEEYPTRIPDASSQLAFQDLQAYASMNDTYQWNPIHGGGIFVEGVNRSNVQPLIQEYYEDASFICNQVLLQWDEPHLKVKKHWNFLDQLMPLYSTQSGFYREKFPSTSLMDKAHKLLASISSDDYGLKMITSVTNRATQTRQRRGILIRPIEPPVKNQRNAKYQLRFVNRVCRDYYTREQIKSEDGNILKAALYDENNLVVTSGPLSSASVEVVLLHGDFNAEGQDYWTSEEFSACLVHPQSVKEPPALGGDRVLTLTDGEAELGNAYFQSSSFHARTGKFKMGVKIKTLKESVQEGITSPFLVRVRQGKDAQHLIRTAPDLSVDCGRSVDCGFCRCLVDPDHDIFMYNDAAFCSPECRQQHIIHDERKKKCTAGSTSKAAARPTTHGSTGQFDPSVGAPMGTQPG